MASSMTGSAMIVYQKCLYEVSNSPYCEMARKGHVWGSPLMTGDDEAIPDYAGDGDVASQSTIWFTENISLPRAGLSAARLRVGLHRQSCSPQGVAEIFPVVVVPTSLRDAPTSSPRTSWKIYINLAGHSGRNRIITCPYHLVEENKTMAIYIINPIHWAAKLHNSPQTSRINTDFNRRGGSRYMLIIPLLPNPCSGSAHPRAALSSIRTNHKVKQQVSEETMLSISAKAF